MKTMTPTSSGLVWSPHLAPSVTVPQDHQPPPSFATLSMSCVINIQIYWRKSTPFFSPSSSLISLRQLSLDNYLKSMVSIYSEMGVLKVAKQNQQKLSSFDQVSFSLPIWLTTHYRYVLEIG